MQPISGIGGRSGRIKILYVEAPATRFGSSLSLLTLIRSLDHEAFEAAVVINDKNPIREDLAAIGIRVYPVSIPEGSSITRLSPRSTGVSSRERKPKFVPAWVRSLRDRVFYRRLKASLQSVIDLERPDIIHLNNQISSNRFAYYCRLRGAKLVQHLRTAPLTGNSHIRSLSKCVSSFISISEFVDRSLREEIDPDARSFVVYNPIGAEYFSVPELAERGGEREFVLAQIGRLMPLKGQLIAVQALAELAKIAGGTSSAVRIIFVGESPLDSSYGRLVLKEIDKHDLQRCVEFVPYTPDVPELLRSVDCLVHMAQAPEGFGRVVAEAMAAGRPCVVSTAGALPELVRHGSDGFIVESATEAARALSRLMLDRGLVQDLGREARISALRFDADVHAAAIGRVYREVLEMEFGSRQGDR